jgi:hypothetical protein
MVLVSSILLTERVIFSSRDALCLGRREVAEDVSQEKGIFNTADAIPLRVTYPLLTCNRLWSYRGACDTLGKSLPTRYQPVFSDR